MDNKVLFAWIGKTEAAFPKYHVEFDFKEIYEASTSAINDVQRNHSPLLKIYAEH